MLYFKGVLNSIKICKVIFLHVIPFHIIISWYKRLKILHEKILKFEEVYIGKCRSHTSKKLVNIIVVDIEQVILATFMLAIYA